MPSKSFLGKNELIFFSDLWNLIVKLPYMFTDTKNLSRVSAKSTGWRMSYNILCKRVPYILHHSASWGKQQANDRKQRRKTNQWLLGSQSQF